MRPLDRVGSIKRKLGIVIVAAVLVTVAVLELGRRAGWPAGAVTVLAVALALAMVQLLAHGMTLPLRQMARAASLLAAGERHEPVIASSRDEVGELARAFNGMADELARTDELRRDLVANVSHELRTPVAALRAVLENLADGVEAPDRATLDRLVGQTERLQALIAALLDLSRLEAGVIALDVGDHPAGGLLDEAVELVAATPGPPVQVTVDPADLRLHADERRLVQVLVNLLDNARAHAPAGTEVELRAERADAGVRIAVTDRGPGIPADEAERVFERFHRTPLTVDGGTDPARSGDVGRGGGTGLGLAISRWIVELHDGRIAVDTDHRPGCRMVVHLPAPTERP